MNLCHLENGLFRVQSGVLPYKIWTQITPFFIMCERVGKNDC